MLLMEQHPILKEISAFIATHEMAESTFGREAAGDWKLIKELRGEGRARPRRLWPDTEAKIRHFMATYRPTKPASAAA
ncbi:hypothetical protein [Sphingobium yanoikuyae]|uniref:hypothetical protein n=1 Tax=Sphingobium yanoikuyae TaxID=13690 RepID=UPI002014BDCF|nr:hypothetical protein [Sphingobium yanoikuyae]